MGFIIKMNLSLILHALHNPVTLSNLFNSYDPQFLGSQFVIHNISQLLAPVHGSEAIICI